MPVKNIHHINVRTLDLEATHRFYTEVLGMAVATDRPPMEIAGAWYDFEGTQIHVIAGEKAFPGGAGEPGTGFIDHVALSASGYDELKATVLANGCDYRENDLARLWQLFVKDPNGVIFELNFIKEDEPPGQAGPSGEKPYRFGEF